MFAATIECEYIVMEDKSTPKSVLLFSPQELSHYHSIIRILHLKKEKGIPQLEAESLSKAGLVKHFKGLPAVVYETVLFFGDTELAKWEVETWNNLFHKRGTPNEGISKVALQRGLQQAFENLLPYLSLFKWYHQKTTYKRHVQTAPCSFSIYRPQLRFEVIKQQNRLLIEVVVMLNGAEFPFETFTQFDFWLESNHEYFLLRFKDFQTLQWLISTEVWEYEHAPALFKEKILAVLEENYKVNRNGHFKETHLTTAPINRVMLSEISGSFLMLTPQWLYENFLVDGAWKETKEVAQSGEIFIIHRNKEVEATFEASLRQLHPNFAKQNNGYFYLSFADAQKKSWFLKVYHQLLDQNIELVGIDMLQHFRYSPHKAVTEVAIIKQQQQTLTLSFSVKFGTEELGLLSLQKILLAGQKAILLKDGSLGILSDQWIQQYGAIVKHGRINKKEIEVARWIAIQTTAEETGDEDSFLQPSITKEWWQKWSEWQSPETVSIYPLPTTIQATLRPYQQKGFEWMALLAEVGAGACLADDMGLGKTLQTICLLAHQHAMNPADISIIICPASLMYNWEQELQKFTPHFKMMIYHGSQRNFDSIATEMPHIIITTYGTLRADIDQLTQITFGVAVVDESHNIKNPAALITRAIAQLHAKTRVALSGTPVMNNTFDLYAQLSFLLPGMFGSRDFFKKEYADPIDYYQEESKIKALQKITAPFILRRTKEQVAKDLPEKMESILWCRMGQEQKEAYNTIKEKVRNSVFLEIKEKGFGSGKLSVIAGMLKLRQICNSCLLVKDEDVISKESIKTEVLVDELTNLIGSHKVLVFSQFTSMLDLLGERFEASNIPYLRLDGSTPIDKRQALVNEFQSETTKARVFLISLKAGNAGLNLTAADYVFLFDPWWNTAVQQQAIDRAHRIGQTQQVFAYQMICKGTIEEKIIQLQQRKKKLAEDLIGEEEGFLKSLSEEDVAFLFG